MLNLIQQYSALPENVRAYMNLPQTRQAIDDLERQYKVTLNLLLIKILVKAVAWKDFELAVTGESHLSPLLAKNLKIDLKERIFNGLINQEADKGERKITNKEQTTENKQQIINNNRPQEKKSNNFHFDEHDAKEIEHIAKSVQPSAGKSVDPKKLEEVLKQINLNFPVEFLMERLFAIVRAGLAGVRDSINTRLMLMRPIVGGGLNLPSEEADRIIKIIYPKILEQNASRPAFQLPQKNQSIARDAEYDLVGELKKRSKEQGVTGDKQKEANRRQEATNNNQERLLAPNNNELNNNKLIADIKPRIIGKGKQDAILRIKNSGFIESDKLNSRLEKKQSFDPQKIRPRVSDVNIAPRLIGPMDELRYMSLIDFRRLHLNPADAIIKIKDKINLIGYEDNNKKRSAIDAWRASQVNQLYLEIGKESIQTGISVRDVIGARLKNNHDTLKPEEFRAIGELNREMRY